MFTALIHKQTSSKMFIAVHYLNMHTLSFMELKTKNISAYK